MNEETKQDPVNTQKIDELFDFTSVFEKLNLKDLFFKGYVRSGEIKLGDISLEVRTLLMDELIRINEYAHKFLSPEARNRAFMVEYLVYSIITLNGSPILMELREAQDFKEKYNREPSLEDQARWVLMNKVPPLLLEVLYLIATKFKMDFDLFFMKEIERRIQDVIKQRERIFNPVSGVSNT